MAGKKQQQPSVDDLFADVKPSDVPAEEPKGNSFSDLIPDEPGLGVGDLDFKGMGRAALGGAVDGLTLGYAKKHLPQLLQDNMNDHPIAAGAGGIAGALAPSVGVAKGVALGARGVGAAVEGLPILGRAAKAIGTGEGILHGAASAGAEAALSDPGEDGDRGTRSGIAAMLGAAGGAVGNIVSRQARRARVFDTFEKPGFAEDVKGKVNNALGSLMDTQVTPRVNKVEALVKDASIPVDTDDLRGLQRPALRGKPRMKGGLDNLAEAIEHVSIRDEAPTQVSGQRALRLKRYFDGQADYEAGRRFSDQAVAREASHQAKADYFRRQLEKVNPEVEGLNAEASKALKLRADFKKQIANDPIAAITPDPSTGRGQKVLELDQLAGSDLNTLGGDILAARRARNAPSQILSFSSIPALARLGGLGIGKAAAAVRADKLPSAAKLSALEALLNGTRNSSSADEE